MIYLIHPTLNYPLFEIPDGLVNNEGELIFRKKGGAFRIVQGDNYAKNFGFQWNSFYRTQIDKFSGLNLTEKRFFACSGWKKDLENENILEAGSGAGRFTQIVLDHTKANIYSFDYTDAVEANFLNNGPNERLKLFQADLYQLPFIKNSFDKVFCFGVLQHTPDVRKSVKSLIEQVKPGGELVVDFYPRKGWYTKFNAKYMLRPFLKRMNHRKLLKIIRKNVGWLSTIYLFNLETGFSFFNRFLPIAGVENPYFRLGRKFDKKELITLDTFDMFSPWYDQPQKIKTVVKWFKESGMIDVEASYVEYEKGFKAAVVKGRKPN